jgi:hypothetical protein
MDGSAMNFMGNLQPAAPIKHDGIHQMPAQEQIADEPDKRFLNEPKLTTAVTIVLFAALFCRPCLPFHVGSPKLIKVSRGGLVWIVIG